MQIEVIKKDGYYFINGNKVTGGEYFVFNTSEKPVCIYFKINGAGIKPHLKEVTDFEVVNIWDCNTESYVVNQIKKKINRRIR